MPLPPLSDEDKQFLRAILANPAELTAWLAYADWLDEHQEPLRSEFLRLEVQLTAATVTQTERHRIAARLEELRPQLDPNWVAVFDRPRIENCDATFAFKCPKKWEQLRGTDDPNVRHCETCDEEIHYCHSLAQARGHALNGHCVAVATGVDRFPGDLGRRGAGAAASATAGAVAGEMLMGRVRVERARRREPEPPNRPWWKFW